MLQLGAGTTLKLVDGSSFGSGIVTDNGTRILDFNSDVALANVINGVGGLEKDGTGLLVLNGADTYSGGTVINSGTVRMSTARALGSAAGNLAINDGALDLFNQSLSVGSLAGVGANAMIINSGTVVNARGATLTTTTAASTTFAGTIQDGVGAKTTLIKAGTGTLTLTGNNNYVGGTTINAGALQLGNGGTTGSITGNVTNKGILIFDRSDHDGGRRLQRPHARQLRLRKQ